MNDTLKLNKKMTRKPVCQRTVLGSLDRPGFKRRIVNDSEGRIAMFEEGGYKIVHGENFTHTKTAHSDSQPGSPCRKVVNDQPDARCKYGYLMEIPEDLYYEDQKYKQQLREEKVAQLDPENKKQNGSDYGKMTVTEL